MLKRFKRCLCPCISQDPESPTSGVLPFAEATSPPPPILPASSPCGADPPTSSDVCEVKDIQASLSPSSEGATVESGCIAAENEKPLRDIQPEGGMYKPLEAQAAMGQAGVDGPGQSTRASVKVQGPMTTSKEGHASAMRKGLSVAKVTISIAESLSGLFPPFDTAVGCLKKIVDIADGYLENKESIASLQERIEQIKDVLVAGRPTGNDSQSRKILEAKLLHVVNSLEQMQSANSVRKVVMVDSIAAKIEAYLGEVEQALDTYRFVLEQETHNAVQEIHHTVNKSYDKQKAQGDSERLHRLRQVKVEGAVFIPERPGCLKGTRLELLEELRQWAADPEGPQVYWLNGHAGSGKSTIAQSFAALLASQGDLGASFFCDRKSQDRSNVEKILPTLSSQLADSQQHRAPLFKEALLRELTKDESLAGSTSLQVQLDHLLVAPARESHLSTVILIDALDECNQGSASTLLSILAPSFTQISSIKFFITSRRDKHIEAPLFGLLTAQNNVLKDKWLHEVGAVEDDIRLFVETELRSVASSCEQEGLDIPPDWPSKNQIEALVKMAGELFVFASTAIKALKDLEHDPVAHLDKLLSAEHRASQDSPYAELDMLYLRILADAFPAHKSSLTSNLSSILGLLVVTREPLCSATIAEFLSITRNTVVLTLRPLHAVLLLPAQNAQDTPIGFHHKSFIDFLTQRCEDSHFRIDMSQHHLHAARKCFSLMSAQYNVKPKNVCNLPQYSRNDWLSVAARDKLISQAIKYSCLHWADHLLAVSDLAEQLATTNSGLKALLSSFIETMYLWWLEVLVLLQESQSAVRVLDKVYTWLSWRTSDDAYKDIIRWISEARHFMTFAIEAIQESVAHIYHSALPFSPRKYMYRRFLSPPSEHGLSTGPRVIMGADETWPDDFQIISLSYRPDDIEYSPDGSLIAASDIFGSMTQLLHADTGEAMHTFHRHSEEYDVRNRQKGVPAFSPDNRIFATACNKSVRLWDVVTGTAYSSSEDHETDIAKLSFHHDGHDLLVIDTKGNIYIWDISDPKNPQGPYRPMLGEAWSPPGYRAFRPICWVPRSGQKIAAVGCRAGSVEIWNVGGPDSTPRVLKDFQPNAWAERVDVIAVSSNGCQIAAGSAHGITIYNADTCGIIYTMSFGESGLGQEQFFFSLNFSSKSPCDMLVVHTFEAIFLFYPLRQEHRLIQVWGQADSVIIGPSSAALSPDDRFLAAIFGDWRIRIRELSTLGPSLASQSKINGPPGPTVAGFAHFSPNGRLIVSGSYDSPTMHIWSTTDGTSSEISHEDFTSCASAIFLMDDTYVVCLHNDGAMVLWNRKLGQITCEDAPLAESDESQAPLLSADQLFPSTFKPRGVFCCAWRELIGPVYSSIYYFEVKDTGNGDVQLQLLAYGSIEWPSSSDLSVAHVHHHGASSTAEPRVIVEYSNGKQFVASFNAITTDPALSSSPQILSFTETRSLVPATNPDVRQGEECIDVDIERPCLWSADNAWVIEKNYNILWVPPIYRGEGCWWKKKLLLMGTSGRLTLIDFSDVDLNSDAPF